MKSKDIVRMLERDKMREIKNGFVESILQLKLNKLNA